MGSLVLPSTGEVYADTSTLIYSVEHHPVYSPFLDPLWDAVHEGTVQVISSDLALLETLVVPIRSNDTALIQKYEDLFVKRGISLVPISSAILRKAAALRANIPSLRTPDAIHAATALTGQCAMFLTNDPGFRRVPDLPVTVLDDLLHGADT